MNTTPEAPTDVHTHLDLQAFLLSPISQKFSTFLEHASTQGEAGSYAKGVYIYLKRKRLSIPKSTNTTSINTLYKNILNKNNKLKEKTDNTSLISTQLYIPQKKAEKHGDKTHINSESGSFSTHSSDYTSHSTQYNNNIVQDTLNCDTTDSSSNKYDKSHITRSASVDLFLNFDKNDSTNSTQSTDLHNGDGCTYIATAPVISLKQRNLVNSGNFGEPNYLNSADIGIEGVRVNYGFGSYGNPMGLPPARDDSSWTCPPSSNPCFIQYKLAKQYNRNLLLPGVIGLDLESEPVDEESKLLQQDMKRFFARIYPSKRTRYTALSDYLKHYPQCILDLLRGPFGHTAFENTLHLRCFNNCNFVNYSPETRAHEVIIPPPDVKKPLRLWIGTYGIPRDDKRHRGGEDVWFACNTLNAMGIADGVSEWMDLVGVNPREFAEDLLRGTLEELYKLKPPPPASSAPSGASSASTPTAYSSPASSGQNSTTPITEAPPPPPSYWSNQALTSAYKSAKHYGSSTAIVGLLDPKTSHFGIANLGDSGCLVLRRSSACGQLTIVARIKEMQHGFNVPYQFTHLPSPHEWESLKQQNMSRIVSFAQSEYRRALELGKSIGDTPDDIQTYDMPVCDGDLIIIGSDGLFDNLFDYEITSLTALAVSPREAQLLYHNVRLATSPKDISRSLALAAYWKSLDPQAKTPFSKNSRKYTQTLGLVDFNGGKEDDISIAVAWVTAT